MLNNDLTRWRYLFCLTTMLASGFVRETGGAEFNYDSYRPYSLAQAIADHPHQEQADWVVEAGDFKYRVRVIYTGQQRGITANVKQLLKHWAKTLGQDPKIPDLFGHEILVREGISQYWLPIQEPPLSFLVKEVRPGDTVELYVVLIGTAKTEWVFAVNEFQSLKASP